jgi:hypothetical protein
MIVHSDSFIGVMLLLLVMLGTGAAILASAVLLLALKFRQAFKVLAYAAVTLSVFFVLQITLLTLTPQAVVKIGDSFCADIWCIGVTNVSAAPRQRDTIYKVDVHIFSDAGRGGKIHGKAILFLVDERGRRFPLIPDPSVIPFNRELDPQEGIDTTLTFAAPSDARQLYLTSEPTDRHSFVVRVFTGDWLAESFPSIHKPALLRVL